MKGTCVEGTIPKLLEGKVCVSMLCELCVTVIWEVSQLVYKLTCGMQRIM